MEHSNTQDATSDYLPIRLKDILLADNCSKRGKEALARVIQGYPTFVDQLQDFYSACYVRPCFENYDELADNDVEENEDDDFFSDERIDLRDLLDSKDDFEIRLSTLNQLNPFLLIRGASGSGKTSYLNYLKLHVIPRNSKIIDCNLEYAQATVEKGGGVFPPDGTRLPSVNGTIPSAPWLFLLTILNQSFDTIWDVLWETTLRTEEIKENFNLVFEGNHRDKDSDIFDVVYYIKDLILSDGINQRIDNEYWRQPKKDLLDCLCSYIDTNMDSESIVKILRISTRILLCISDWIKHSCYYYIFDSIENYIDVGKKIYDGDIRVIADSVYNFVTTEITYFSNLQKKETKCIAFQQKFKIVMCVRDSTNRMFSASVHSYFEAYVRNSVDVSCCYNVEEIIQMKLDYFTNKKIISSEHPSIRFFEVVNNDKFGNSRSIVARLEYMYNRNKRRIIQVLIAIADEFYHISLRENQGASLSVLTLTDFESLWSVTYTNPQYNHYRYLCRRATLRLVWNEISKTGYFRSIYVQPEYEAVTIDNQLIYIQKSSEIHTFARRILNWLSANKNGDPQGYVGFNSLIRGICSYAESDVKQGLFIDPVIIQNIATVLVSLYETRFENERDMNESSPPNKWSNLIKIRFNDKALDGNINVPILEKELKAACEADCDNIKDFAVSITDAGRFFTYMQADFEFFACRYNEDNTPLLFMRSYEAVKALLDFVFERARACVFAVIASEYKMCKGSWQALKRKGYHYQNNNGTELRYPIRIIDSHIRYIDSLLRVVQDYKENQYLNDVTNEAFKTLLRNTITKYNSVRNQLYTQNLKIQLSKNNSKQINPPYLST